MVGFWVVERREGCANNGHNGHELEGEESVPGGKGVRVGGEGN